MASRKLQKSSEPSWPDQKRSNFIKRREIAIAVRDDVGDPVAVAEEKINQAEGSDENQSAGRHPCLPRALDQQRMPRANRENAAYERIYRANEGQQECK